jgi:hypothetical protein
MNAQTARRANGARGMYPIVIANVDIGLGEWNFGAGIGKNVEDCHLRSARTLTVLRQFRKGMLF